MVVLSSLGGDSSGVWTRTQALALTSPGRVRGALARDWQVVWPGTYADAGYHLTPEQHCWAAVLASGDRRRPGRPPFGPDRRRTQPRPDRPDGSRHAGPLAVACGRTAARYWGIPLVDDDDPATGACESLIDDVTVGTHLPPVVHAGRRLRRHRLRLGQGEVVRTTSGCPITSPTRTLVDCCAFLAPDAAVCALDHALHRRLVTRPELETAVATRRGLAGSAALRRAVGLTDGRAETPLETLTRLLLLPALPTLEPQVVLLDETDHVIARFDLADRTRKLAVESDGKPSHSGAAMVARDRARDLRSERYGWWTERVTWFDVRRRQRATVARVLARAQLLDERRDVA